MDAQLLPLANNGGLTQTHALQPTSPAIGKSNPTLPAGLTTDQRGFQRPGIPNVTSEIGAYEVQLVTISPNTLPNGTVGTAYSRSFSALAAALPAGTTFTFTNPVGLPPGLTLSATGVLSGTPTSAGTGTVVIAAIASTGDFGVASLNFTVDSVLPPPPPPPGSTSPSLVGFREFAVGGDVGSGTARLYNPNATERFTTIPFAGFAGGVRTVAADFNGDGIADLVVGTGPGIATLVRVLDGATQAELFSIAPFEAAFVGGVFVTAGDINGDGRPDLVITPDEGGGPRVRIFSGNGFTQLDDFFGIEDTAFRGGARAGVGDLNGDGVSDLVVAAGFGGGPRVAAFSGVTIGTTGRRKLFPDFFAFEVELRNGTYVTVGDVTGDRIADLIAGGGPGGGPRVTVFGGAELLNNVQNRIADFFAGDTSSRGGIRLAVKNLDGDASADLVVGAGTGAGSRVTGYLGTAIRAGGTPPAAFQFDALAGFTGGVFVG